MNKVTHIDRVRNRGQEARVACVWVGTYLKTCYIDDDLLLTRLTRSATKQNGVFKGPCLIKSR